MPPPPPDPDNSAAAPPPPTRRRSLHNFSFPQWGSHRSLRCLRTTPARRRSLTVPNPAAAAVKPEPGELLPHVKLESDDSQQHPAKPVPETEPKPVKRRRRRRGLELDPPPPLSLLPAGERESRSKALRHRSEDGERPKFAITLSRQEIAEDFYSISGSLPSRRPRKRTLPIQRQLDSLFPGSWLSEVTADAYKVTD